MNIREYRKLSTSENDHHGKIRKWSPYELFFWIKKECDHHVGLLKKFWKIVQTWW